MPLALRDLQSAFAAHLSGEDQQALVAEILPAAERLRIHRHHMLDSLAAALAATFPTVQAVVGAEFFRGLARAFIGGSLPTQPVLAEYGAGFPAFIA
ncbi:MAG TPA: DNA-binding domain-containing protein, partial [Reyranella sp.]|nr:DNA-binding domain-containing protein [Reyranella sp.]